VGVDDPRRRGRRAIEWACLGSRLVALAWIMVTYLVLDLPPGANPLSGAPWHFGALLCLPVLLVSAVGVVALRNVDRPSYRWLSALQTVADTAAIIALVAAVDHDRRIQMWPLYVIPILVAAFRHELSGALLVWSATSLASAFCVLFSPLLYGFQIDREAVIVGPWLHLVVAVLTGLLAREQRRHLVRLAEIRSQLHHQARHDPLTGLGNRNLLHELAETRSNRGRTMSVLVLDLDGFKLVNDAFGHAAGDELLRETSRRLRRHAREGDVVARLGGDEFVIVLHDADAARAESVGERLRRALGAPVPLDGATAHVDASIGTATGDGGNLDELLRAADGDMYRVKLAHRAERDTARPIQSRGDLARRS
jgi:diguanylate cyclase (GGDEF)-like protein